MPDDKPDGILDFLFGRWALKKAADQGHTVTPPTQGPSQSTYDYLSKEIAKNPNNQPQATPTPDAMKVLAAPSKNSKAKKQNGIMK